MNLQSARSFAWMTEAAAIAAAVGEAYLPAVPSFRSLRRVIMQDPTEALAETAKAVREVAKTVGNAIDAGRQAGGLLDRIFWSRRPGLGGTELVRSSKSASG